MQKQCKYDNSEVYGNSTLQTPPTPSPALAAAATLVTTTAARAAAATAAWQCFYPHKVPDREANLHREDQNQAFDMEIVEYLNKLQAALKNKLTSV